MRAGSRRGLHHTWAGPSARIQVGVSEGTERTLIFGSASHAASMSSRFMKILGALLSFGVTHRLLSDSTAEHSKREGFTT
jgi:hypothetical protein